MGDGAPLLIGTPNGASRTTVLLKNVEHSEYALVLSNENGAAISATSQTGLAVEARSNGPTAIFASSGSGPAIYAISESGPVISATLNPLSTDPKRAAVEGNSYDIDQLGATANGVHGGSTHGYGVEAVSADGVGLYALSTDSDGIWAITENRGGGSRAVNAQAENNGTGIFGVSYGKRGISQTGFAGKFWGQVLVQGRLVVTGTKSAAVAHPDGSHRLLYSLESPESWFEDFGEGKLSRGRGQVKLNADFAALVSTDSYHVFLTPKGDSNGLYVSQQSRSGFEVREQKGGKSTLTFSYRVVAHRKDTQGRRLERVAIPKLPKKDRAQKIEAPQEAPDG
jgi:hypothetical protein